MSPPITIAVGPYRFALNGALDGALRGDLADWFGAYVSPGAPDVVLSVEPAPVPSEPAQPRTSGDAASFEAEGPGFRARLMREGDRWRGTARALPDRSTLDSLVRSIATPCLLGEAALLHAAAVEVDGVVHLFAGPSGAGKSTMAARFPAPDVYNDDLVVVRETRDGWEVGSTPFLGRLRSPAPRRGPLGAVHLIGHGTAVAARSVERAEAVRRLLACVYLCPGSGGNSAAALGFARRLAEAAPPSELLTARDSAVEEIVSALRAALLAARGRIVFRARGASMAPFVRDGDWVTVRSAQSVDLACGDIAVLADGARWVTHRLMWKAPGAVWTKGDATWRIERFDLGGTCRVIGRVEGVMPHRPSWPRPLAWMASLIGPPVRGIVGRRLR